MSPFEIEAWTLRVLDQVTRGSHAEDSRVELKTTWPRAAQAARQIAGHANAARGTPILWVIGVDEKKGAVGASYEELANWYSEVRSHFDDSAPALQDLNIIVDSQKTIVALLFHTDRSPYVVKNGTFGQSGGGAVELEVPWREGRQTRSARRTDLVRLLTPLIHLPSTECLGCEVTVNAVQKDTGEITYRWFIYFHFYMTPNQGETVVIPFHRCRLLLLSDASWKLDTWSTLRVRSETDSLTIASSRSEIIINGPGKVDLYADAIFDPGLDFRTNLLTLSAKMFPVETTIPIAAEKLVIPVDLNGQRIHHAKWGLGLNTI